MYQTCYIAYLYVPQIDKLFWRDTITSGAIWASLIPRTVINHFYLFSFNCTSRADSKLVSSQWKASLPSNTLSLAGSKPRISPESRRSASYQGNFGAFQSKHQSLVVLNLCMTDGFYDNVIKWNQFPRYWPLCGESTRDADVWCFLWSALEQTIETRVI